MDMAEATNKFQDWEVIHSSSDSESSLVHSSNSADTVGEIDSSEGVIKANYFSIDSRTNLYSAAQREDSDDNRSAESDNPSWVDPGLEENPTRCTNKESTEFLSDSRSNCKSNDFEGRDEIGMCGKGNEIVSMEEIQQLTDEKAENEQILGKYDTISGEIEGRSTKLNELEDNSVSEVDMEEKPKLCEGLEISGEETCENKEIEDGTKGMSENKEIEDGTKGMSENGAEKSREVVNRGVVWWKMPMEFLRYCVLRVSPVWTVSVAAAVMGLLMVGRRLYKMKKKTKALQIKVTVDDKKVSQVMSRAARLNEAFYIVKRVPVIRPSLPAIGVSTWPATSLR